MNEALKKFITVKEASELLGVTPLTLRNWDKSGKLPAGRHPLNNYRVYLREDIEKLLTEMAAKPERRPTPPKAPAEEKKGPRKLQVTHL